MTQTDTQQAITVQRNASSTLRNGILVLLLVGGFLFRLVLMLQFRYAVSFDEPHYLRLAAAFLARGLPGLAHPYWPPLYPALTGLVRLVVGDFELAGRLINVASGTVIILLVYQLTRRLFGKSAARLSAALAALYPPLAFGSTSVMPETFYTALSVGGVALGWRALTERNPRFAFAAGCLWGAGYLVKPEGIGYLAVFLLFAGVWALVGFRSEKRLGRFGIPVFALVGVLLVSGPYLVWLHQTLGVWTLSAKGEINQQMEAAVYFNAGEVKDPFFHLTSDNRHLPYDMALHFGDIQSLRSLSEGRQRYVSIPLSQYAEKYGRNLYHILRYSIPQLLTAALLILWAAGFFGRIVGPVGFGLTAYLLATVAFYWFGVVPAFHVNDRYLAPLLPLCLVWMGPGLQTCADWTQRQIHSVWQNRARVIRMSHTLAWVAVFILFLGFSVLPELARILAIHTDDDGMWADPVELKEAGLWLKGQTDHPPALLSLNKAVDYYAGQMDMRKGASFSYDPLDRNLAYARHRGVRHVVFTSRYQGWFRNLEDLMQEAETSPQLRQVYEKAGPGAIRTLIYELLPDADDSGEDPNS